MKIELVKYQAVHGYDILGRNVKEQNLQLSRYPDWENTIKAWEAAGPSFTLLVEDKIVGSAGVVLHSEGRGEAWALLSSLFFNYKKTSLKYIKNKLSVIAENYSLRRVQILVDPNNLKALIFAERLGFQQEGLLRAYGSNGEDYFMFSRIFRL
jgi:L-amino acid N-acyltransferase YncA